MKNILKIEKKDMQTPNGIVICGENIGISMKHGEQLVIFDREAAKKFVEDIEDCKYLKNEKKQIKLGEIFSCEGHQYVISLPETTAEETNLSGRVIYELFEIKDNNKPIRFTESDIKDKERLEKMIKKEAKHIFESEKSRANRDLETIEFFVRQGKIAELYMIESLS